jgi:probable phosphoglycerate mutase
MTEGARVLLARHGWHDWLGSDNRFAGRLPGVPLNAAGREQARALGRRLQAAPPDRILCSPLERTRQTAEIIAGYVQRPATPDERLIETDLGSWQGMRVQEVATRDAEAYRAWRTAPTQARLPGAEPLEAMADRMAACAFEALARGGATLLVSHQDPLLALVCRLLDLPLDAMRRMEISPGSLTILEVARGRPVLVGLNSATSGTR